MKVTKKPDPKMFSKRWASLNRKPLARAGKFVSRIAIRSVRKRKSDEQKLSDFLSGKNRTFRKGKGSPVGTPPFSRGRSNTPHVYRSIDYRITGKGSVAINHVGPAAKISAIHEFGKTVKIRGYKKTKTRGKRNGRSSKQRRAAAMAYASGKLKGTRSRPVTMTVRMPKRPTLRPALEKAKPKLAGMWANAFK